jgi:hypothetical protein
LTIDKISWARAGRVSQPGRYMFRFGWLTITAEDLSIWQKYPNATFTLYRPAAAETEHEFRLGVFDLPDDPSSED